MTNSGLGDATAKRKLHERHASVTSEVADIIRQCSSIDARRGFRVIAKGSSGHVFFDRGRVVHAEFGEDCGLRAIVEMLRAGVVQLEPVSSWPSQPSLHLGPELLLSLTAGDASRVVRKVDLPVGPPPLPDPEETEVAELGSPFQPEPARAPGKRAISGVMPRVVERANPPSIDLEGEAGGAAAAVSASTAALASRRSAAVAAGRLAASVAVSERARARATGQRTPPAPPVRPERELEPRVQTPAPFEYRASSDLPITRAQRARSRSIVVARTASAQAPSPAASTVRGVSPQAPAAKLPALPAESTGSASPVSVSAKRARAAAAAQQPTTMVRIAARGDLLAARGRNAEQLAEAAAFIHGLANLIAADFGRHGRANVHLSGGGMSLLVARSEVNDIAAALGSTERLTSLLGKVGFK
jgi:hypothetical protein